MIRKERIQISFPIPNYTKETDQQTQTGNEKIQIAFPMLNYSNLILMPCQPHRVTSGQWHREEKAEFKSLFLYQTTQNSKETNRHRQGHTDTQTEPGLLHTSWWCSMPAAHLAFMSAWFLCSIKQSKTSSASASLSSSSWKRQTNTIS